LGSVSKRDVKPSEKKKNQFIKAEVNNTLRESKNNQEKIKNNKGPDKIVGEMINLNCSLVNTDAIKKHILEQSKSNNKLAKMKISAKIADAPSCDIELTPIPTKNEWRGYKSEREEYNQAARAAVLLRRLEYSTKLQNAKTEKYIEEIYVQLLYEAKVIQIQRWFRNSLKKRRSSVLKEDDNELLKEKMESIFDLIRRRVKQYVMFRISEYYYSIQQSDDNEDEENRTNNEENNEEAIENNELNFTISKLIFLQNEVRLFLQRQRRKKILFRKIMYKVFKRNISYCLRQIKNRETLVNKLILIQRFYRGHAYRRKVEINQECPHPLLKIFLKFRTEAKFFRIKTIFFKFIRRLKFLRMFPLIKVYFDGIITRVIPNHFRRIIEIYFKYWRRMTKKERRVCTMINLAFGKIIKDVFFNKFIKTMQFLPLYRDLKRNRIITFIYLISKRDKFFIFNKLKDNFNRVFSQTKFNEATATGMINTILRIIQKNKYNFLLHLSNRAKSNTLKKHFIKSILLAKDKKNNKIINNTLVNWSQKIKDLNSFYAKSCKGWLNSLQFKIVDKLSIERKRSLLSELFNKKHSTLYQMLEELFLKWRKITENRIISIQTLYDLSYRFMIQYLKKMSRDYNLYARPRKRKSIFGIIGK